MKSILSTLLCLLMYSALIQAQVSEKTKTMSLGTQNALIVSIPDAKEKMIVNIWKDYMKEFGRVKRNRKTKEYFSDDVKIPSISGAGTMDIYVGVEEGQLIAFFDMGNGFLSKESHKEAFEGALVFLEEFNNEVTREIISDQIKDEEKILSKMERSLTKLIKDNEKYHNAIKKAEEKIEKARDDIEQNIIDQANADLEIESQKDLIKDVQDKLEKVGK